MLEGTVSIFRGPHILTLSFRKTLKQFRKFINSFSKKNILLAGELYFLRRKYTSELLLSQSEYVERLDACCKMFSMPLRSLCNSQHEVLSGNSIRVLFSCIEALRVANQTLLKLLEEAVSRHAFGVPSIGNIFFQCPLFFEAHEQYASDFPASVAMLEELRRESKIFLFEQDALSHLEKMESKSKERNRRNPRCSFELQELLHLPMQRIVTFVAKMDELAAVCKNYIPNEAAVLMNVVDRISVAKDIALNNFCRSGVSDEV